MIKICSVDLMFEQPDGWLRASLPKMEAATRSINELITKSRSDSSWEVTRDFFQRQSWITRTGTEPVDTHFSIIVPVHNEERSLPSFLGAFFLSEMPSMADIQVIFVVNASNDNSLDLIKKRLAHIHQLDHVVLPSSICDPKRFSEAYQALYNNIRFLIVVTPTPGKANALNIGNEITQQRGHMLAINIDANNWVEPDSIGMLYGRAKNLILDTPASNVVLINSSEYYPARNSQIQVSVKQKTQKAEVTGCMFAWSVEWISQNNGFPQYAIEDYGTGLQALSQGKKIADSDAGIWVYSASNSMDENKELIRFIYGAMQLARLFEHNPLAIQILTTDFPHLLPVRARMEYFIFRKRKVRRLFNVVRGILSWLLNEFLIIKARQKLRSNPDGQTWDPIKSTK